MRLGSPAFAAAVSVFMALSVGPVSAIPPTSGSTAGITLSGPNEAYVYYRGGYGRAYYGPRRVYRRTYRRAYRRAAYYPSSSYYGYTYPSAYYQPSVYR